MKSICLIIVAALSDLVWASPSKPPVPITGKCSAFLTKIPKELQYEWLEVPEVASNKNGPKIHVFYWGRFSGTGAPVIVYNGGPNRESHALLTGSFGGGGIYYERLKKLKMPFVVMDQRGTGCSTQYPLGQTSEVALRLSHWGAEGIISDSEWIRKKLFQSKPWKVMGRSYGSIITHHYLATFPESILAAFAAGYSARPNELDAWQQNQVAEKKESDKYFAKYPEDLGTLKTVRALFPRDHCFQSGSQKVCGSSFTDLLAFKLTFLNRWTELHETLNGFLDSDKKLNWRNINAFVEIEMGPQKPENQSMALSVLPIMEVNGGLTDTQMCLQIIKQLRAKSEDIDSWPLMDCRFWSSRIDSLQENVIAPLRLHKPIDLTKIANHLRKFPSLQFYLYSGGRDSTIPAETFEWEVKTLRDQIKLPNFKYRNFPDSGHEGFQTENQIWSDMDTA